MRNIFLGLAYTLAIVAAVASAALVTNLIGG
jgi:hypothetical protein